MLSAPSPEKHIAATSAQTWFSKGILLAVLSIQHCLVGVITRKSQTSSSDFLPQTGVICQELVKICVSLLLAVLSGERLTTVLSSPRELARASVPALLYLVQNNLQYVALAYLEPASYVVTYQLKILSTAAFSVMLLRRQLSVQKWTALALLVVGVSMVQLSTISTPAKGASAASETAFNHRLIGLAAVLTTCVLSGIAGVYTEMILKESSVTLWVRNIQLAAYSLIFGALGLTLTEPQFRSNGFFAGYNAWVVSAIINNSFGGLLIAVIIKYADNILKNFATSVSIVLTTAASIYLGMEANGGFLTGVIVVCCATFLYGSSQTPFQLVNALLGRDVAGKGSKAA